MTATQPKLENGNFENLENKVLKSKVQLFFEHKFTPKDKLYVELNIGSRILYNNPILNGIRPGTIRWTGKTKNGKCLYGIELRDPIDNGTNGTFNNQKLFECLPGHGIVAKIDQVKPSFLLDDRNEELPEAEIVDYLLFDTTNNDIGIQTYKSYSNFAICIAALFSKHEFFDHYLLRKCTEKDKNDKQILDLLKFIAYFIVKPLRTIGYANLNNLENQKYQFKDKSIDEFLDLVIKIHPGDSLLQFISYNSFKSQRNTIQLNISNSANENGVISIQKMIELHLIENQLMFNHIPRLLIVEILHNSDEPLTILPYRDIDLSPFFIDYNRKCIECNEKALSLCQLCSAKCMNDLDSKSSLLNQSLYCSKHSMTRTSCIHNNDALVTLSVDDNHQNIINDHLLQFQLCSIVQIKDNEQHVFVYDDKNYNWLDFSNEWENNEKEDECSEIKIQTASSIDKFLKLSNSNMNKEYKTCSTDVSRLLNHCSLMVYHNPILSFYPNISKKQ